MQVRARWAARVPPAVGAVGRPLPSSAAAAAAAVA